MDIRERFIEFMSRKIGVQGPHAIRSGTRIIDNVKVILTDEVTGEQVTIAEAHNEGCNFEFHALCQWMSGKNNTGQGAISPPSQVQLGSGSGTPGPGDPGLFNAIANTLVNLSYATPDSPQNGTCTFVFQIAAGVVTVQVTEALLRDASGNPWNHTMFPAPFTPTSQQNITIVWEVTFSN